MNSELKSCISSVSAEDRIDNSYSKFDDKIKSSKNNNTDNDIHNIFFDLSRFSFFVNSIGHHQKSIVNQKNNRQRQSYIDRSLKIGVDIISEPIQGVCYFIWACISSLFISSIIKRSLLDLIFIICLINN